MLEVEVEVEVHSRVCGAPCDVSSSWRPADEAWLEDCLAMAGAGCLGAPPEHSGPGDIPETGPLANEAAKSQRTKFPIPSLQRAGRGFSRSPRTSRTPSASLISRILTQGDRTTLNTPYTFHYPSPRNTFIQKNGLAAKQWISLNIVCDKGLFVQFN